MNNARGKSTLITHIDSFGFDVVPNTNIIPSMLVNIKLMDETVLLPQKAHEHDACWDIRSYEDIILKPFEPVKIETGLAFEIPNDYFLRIFSRSGLSSQGIILLNSVGIIDPNYRGYIKIPLMNLTNSELTIHKNDRIAQIGFEKIIHATWNIVDDLSETERGANGFNSSGVK
jgi:dUTP pyrophosphatase